MECRKHFKTISETDLLNYLNSYPEIINVTVDYLVSIISSEKNCKFKLKHLQIKSIKGRRVGFTLNWLACCKDSLQTCDIPVLQIPPNIVFTKLWKLTQSTFAYVIPSMLPIVQNDFYQSCCSPDILRSNGELTYGNRLFVILFCLQTLNRMIMFQSVQLKLKHI